MKSLKSLLLCGVALALISNAEITAQAQSNLLISEQSHLLVERVLWGDGIDVNPYLFVHNRQMVYGAVIIGEKDCTEIEADILLERDGGSGYREVAHFSSRRSSSRLSINKSVTANDGEYRLTVTAKIYYGKNYVTVSNTVYS